jgi:hypothetical protein
VTGIENRPFSMRFCCELPVPFVAAREPRRARAGRSASVRRSVLRTDFPAMLATVARRTTRCVRCALSAQTGATSQMTKRAARAATATALLGASQARCGLPAHALATKGLGTATVEHPNASCCGRRCPVGAISGVAVHSSLGPGAQVRASLTDSRPKCLEPPRSTAARVAAPRGGCFGLGRPGAETERRERSERSEFGRAGPRLVGAAKWAQSADRPSMSPRRTAPAAAARCKERDVQRSTRSTPVIPKGTHTTARREDVSP